MPPDDPGPKASATALKKYGAPTLVLVTTAAVLAIAWWLWTNGSDRGQGAAFALAGGAATHLLKETSEILRIWLNDRK